MPNIWINKIRIKSVHETHPIWKGDGLLEFHLDFVETYIETEAYIFNFRLIYNNLEILRYELNELLSTINQLIKL